MRHAGIPLWPRSGFVRAYEYRNGTSALDADSGSYRPRRGQDALWPPVERAYGGPAEAEKQRRVADFGLAVVRLIVPVALLLVLLGATYLYADDLLPMDGMPVPIRDTGLAISDLILPGAWYCIHLTNRRYGPGYALAQLLAALVIALAVIIVNPGNIDQWVTAPALTGRAVIAFGGALLIANFVGITFFDAARGPRWWTAPLAASFAASAVFSVIYYPAAFAGVDARWMDSAAIHFAAFFGMSVLLLMPYWLLRPAMRPINGMNGY
jgi:uncharacterized PurR-regulated membrane protein YhhQ (DUF165 family)